MHMSKYRNIKTEIDGIWFDSKKEARRYQELKILEQANEISHLECQPAFPCIIEGKKICTYKADFRYFDKKKKGKQGQTGCQVVEDVKSPASKTPVYRLKKKLVEALYIGVNIVEI